MRADIGFEKYARYVFCFSLLRFFIRHASPHFPLSHYFSLPPSPSSFSLSLFLSLYFVLSRSGIFFSRISGSEPAKATHYRVAWSGLAASGIATSNFTSDRFQNEPLTLKNSVRRTFDNRAPARRTHDGTQRPSNWVNEDEIEISRETEVAMPARGRNVLRDVLRGTHAKIH